MTLQIPGLSCGFEMARPWPKTEPQVTGRLSCCTGEAGSSTSVLPGGGERERAPTSRAQIANPSVYGPELELVV